VRNALQISLLLFAVAIASAPSLRAAGYPNQPVKVIVAFPAGGATDIATRLIAQNLSDRLGQQFYIENVGGVGGNLGMANAAATGDGYTNLFASSSIVVNPSL
jgi:tripartite-type tricarboxylate transporter receptor subunit TctC